MAKQTGKAADSQKKEADAKQTAESETTEDSSNADAETSKDTVDIQDLIRSLYEGYGPNGTDQSKKVAHDTLRAYIQQIAANSKIGDKYNLLILHDGSTMIKDDADHIYNAITAFEDSKPVLLVLYSNGGDAGSAYLIGQLCREYADSDFAIAVPRRAKSAATLLCCAADSIHMGSLSELGPIDPQLNNMPALGLKNSVQHIAELVAQHPDSATMFANYLSLSLRPIDLGYYERVAESAVQYAERLLGSHAQLLSRPPAVIAQELVYDYKDHGFVIDKNEAAKVFGKKIVHTGTPEYRLANELYRALSFVEGFAGFLNHNFYFIGSLESDPNFRKQQR